MRMTDLTKIDGVGPSYADELEEAGYESAEDVADADPEAVDGLLTATSGEELVSSAQDEVVLGDDSEKPEPKPKSETTEESSETAETDAEEDAEDDGEEVFTFEPGFTEDQEHHLIAALINEEITSRRRNNTTRLENARGAISQVRDGEPYNFTLKQLSIAYTGTNQLESEYRGTRGLSSFISQIHELSEYFQQARKENWPNSE